MRKSAKNENPRPATNKLKCSGSFCFLNRDDLWLTLAIKRDKSLKYLTNMKGCAIMIKNVKGIDLNEFFCKSKLRFTEEALKERTELFHRLIALPKPERDAVLMAVEYYEAHKHEGRFPDGRK